MSVVGSFGATATGQEPAWPNRAEPPAAPRGISLGRPGPLAGNSVDLHAPTSSLRVIAESPELSRPAVSAPAPALAPAPAPAPAPAAPAAATVAAPVWDTPPRGGATSDVLRLTAFTDSAAYHGRGPSADEPRALELPREVPPLNGGNLSVLEEPRPLAMRWLFRTIAPVQMTGEPIGPGTDVNIFVAPGAPPLAGGGELAPVPLTNPWTGAPLEGAVVDAGEMPMSVEGGILEDFDGGGGGQGPGYRFYARAEYLMWWVRGFYLPPLVTTGPATVDESIRGAPFAPGTTVLFGNTNTPAGPISGARFTIGGFLSECSPWAVEGNFFFLGKQRGHFDTSSAQNPVIARPFFNVNTGMFDRELTATPGLLANDAFKLRGAIAVDTDSQLGGMEANVKRLLCCGCNYNFSALAGFRYLNLREGLTITESVTSLQAVQGTNVFDPGNQITVLDSFRTSNRFYGAQLGLQGEVRRGRWWLGGSAKVALGTNHQTITISGRQTVQTLAGAQQNFVGGLLALPSNIGTFTREQISFVPEVGLKVGYSLTDNLRVFVGYDFMYWTNVVRPGDQIDTALNTSQIPNFNIPPAVAPPSSLVRPVVPFRSTGFWAQGINAGLEFRY